LQARMLPLAQALHKHGHEVVIIAPPHTNPEDAGLVEEWDGVEVRNVLLGPTAGALAAPFIALRMLREALDQQPALIHLFKPKGYGGLAALAQLGLRLAGVRMPLLVVDSDDREGTGGMNDLHPYSWPEKRLFSFQEQYLTRWADGVTVASRTLESLAWGMGARRQQTLYLPNGPLLRPAGDRLQGRQRFGIPLDAPVLLLYTRFSSSASSVCMLCWSDSAGSCRRSGCWWWGRGHGERRSNWYRPLSVRGFIGIWCLPDGRNRLCWPIAWLLLTRQSTPLTTRW